MAERTGPESRICEEMMDGLRREVNAHGRSPHEVGGPRRRPTSAPLRLLVLRPALSGISKRVSRYISQEVCPWNGAKLVQAIAERDYLPRAPWTAQAAAGRGPGGCPPAPARGGRALDRLAVARRAHAHAP